MTSRPASLASLLAEAPRSVRGGARRIAAGVALIAACLFGMVALPHWSASQSRELKEELRETTTPLEVTLARLRYYVLGIANDMRGFALTGDPSFLRTFERQDGAVREDFARAEELARALGEPFMVEMLAAEREYDNWILHMRVLGAVGRNLDVEAIKQQELSGTSLRMRQRLTDRLERLDNRLRAREDALRQQLAGFQGVEQWLVLVLGSLAAVVVGYLAYLAVALVRAQTAMVEERDQLEAVLASADSGILLLDRQLRVLVANRRAGELLGIPLERLIGSDQREVARSLGKRTSNVAAFDKRLTHLYAHPEAEAEDIVELVDPGERTLLRYSAPVRDETGDVSGRIEVYRDVTEWQRRERELAQANERKDRFMATLSHELRTPLAPIFTWLELLRGESGVDKIERGLSAIRRNVALEAQLVEDLLELSMVVNQKLELDHQQMDVLAAASAAVETVQHLASAKNVRLEVRLPRQPMIMTADETRFMQVVWNLLSNAIKFSRSGERVLLDVRQESDRLAVRVEDEGEGISADQLEHIFKPFEQAGDQGLAGRGGLGIGLALSRYIVELHGGEITAHSDGRGRGARFTFWIPIVPLDGKLRAPLAEPASVGAGSPGAARLTPRLGRLAGPDLPEAAEHPAPVAISSRSLGGRVLIVEDNLDTLEAMRRLLVSWGHEVVATDNVAVALEMLRKGPFRTIVSDIGMPEVDGLSFVKEVRDYLGMQGHLPAPTLIAISGYASHSDRQRALAAGFDAYLTKPIDFDLLRGLLEELDSAALETLPV